MKKYNIDWKDVRRLYEVEGKSQQYIADYYSVSRGCIWHILNTDKAQEYQKSSTKNYYEEDKESYKATTREYNHNHREKINKYKTTGLQGARNKIRQRDRYNKQYQWLKRDLGKVHIHHEWIPETDKYSFSALVDASEHLCNIIKPIIILEDNRIELFQEF